MKYKFPFYRGNDSWLLVSPWTDSMPKGMTFEFLETDQLLHTLASFIYTAYQWLHTLWVPRDRFNDYSLKQIYEKYINKIYVHQIFFYNWNSEIHKSHKKTMYKGKYKQKN